MKTLSELETESYELRKQFKTDVTGVLVFSRKVRDRYQEIYSTMSSSYTMTLSLSSNTHRIIKILINNQPATKEEAVQLVIEDPDIDLQIRSLPSFNRLAEVLAEMHQLRQEERIIAKLKYGV